MTCSQAAVVVPLSIKDSFPCVFDEFIQTAFIQFRLSFLDLNGIYPHPFIQIRETAEIIPNHRIFLQCGQNILVYHKSFL